MAVKTKAQLKQYLTEKIRSNGLGGITTALDLRQFETDFIDSVWKIHEDLALSLALVALTGDYNDLTNRPSGNPGSPELSLATFYKRISSSNAESVFVYPELIGLEIYDISRGHTLEVLKNDEEFSSTDQVVFDGESGTLKFSSPFGTVPELVRILSYLANGKRNQYMHSPEHLYKQTGSADFSPGFTVNTGLPISYSSSNPLVATIVNGLIHPLDAGNTTITATQSGNADYNPITKSTQLTVFEEGENPGFPYVLPFVLQ